MTIPTHEIKLEDVEALPATKLLQMRFSELTTLIQEAERRADKLYLTADWLRGIKTEKAFLNGENRNKGGQS